MDAKEKGLKNLIEQRKEFVRQAEEALKDLEKLENTPSNRALSTVIGRHKIPLTLRAQLELEAREFAVYVQRYDKMITKAKNLLRLHGKLPVGKIGKILGIFNFLGAVDDYTEMTPHLRGERIQNDIRAIDTQINEINNAIPEIEKKLINTEKALQDANTALRNASNSFTSNSNRQNLENLNNAINAQKQEQKKLNQLNNLLKEIENTRNNLDKQKTNLYYDLHNIT